MGGVGGRREYPHASYPISIGLSPNGIVFPQALRNKPFAQMAASQTELDFKLMAVDNDEFNRVA